MRKVRKRSPLPVYGIAAVWVIYAIFAPMYSILHFVILAAISVGAYFGLSRLFPGKVEYVEEPEEPVSTGSSEADSVIAEGQKAMAEMSRLADAIGIPAVSGKVNEMRDITGKILKEVERRPESAAKVRQFMNYYIPTTLKLLNAYDRMDDQGIEGSNISGTKGRIEDMLSTSVTAFKRQLDALFADEALDIETDIKVMEGMLKREGLAGKDF